MKKLYTLAAVAALAFSANAQLYIVGSGEGLDWTPETPLTVNLENNAYTVTINNLVQFKMSTAMGDWETFNAAALCCELTKENLGTPVELTLGDANIGTPWMGEYTLVVSADFKTLTATTTTPEPVGPQDIYIRGTINDWSGEADVLAAWKMVPDATDELTYWFDCVAPDKTIPMGAEFKIADASWGNINYGAAGAVYPDEFGGEWNYNAGNGVMGEDYNGTIKFTLNTVAKAPATVIVYPTIIDHGNSGIENVAIDNNAAVEYFNLQGVRVANPTEGLYIVRQGNKVSKVLVK